VEKSQASLWHRNDKRQPGAAQALPRGGLTDQ
jgi:hypothetical protein